MKSDSEINGYFFWNMINTCAIILLAIWLLCVSDLPVKCDKRVTEMEKKFEIYENMKPDSVVIHIHNQVNVPIPKVNKVTNRK